jgi:hypothetical protein
MTACVYGIAKALMCVGEGKGGWGKGRGSEIEQRVPPTGLLSAEALSKTV